MSGYQTKILPNFITTAQSPLIINNPQIIYANFGVFTGPNNTYETRIKPMNLGEAGFFQVTPIGSTMSIQFICKDPVKRAIGMMNLNYPFVVVQEAPNIVRFDLTSLPNLFEGTLSIMVSNFDQNY